MKLLLPALCAWTAAVSPAHADETASDWQLSTPTGVVTELFQVYKQRFYGLPDAQERLDATIDLGLGNGTYGFKLAPWGWVRAPEAVGGAPKRLELHGELKEGWAERTSPWLDVRVGNQIFAWGTADQINPTDVWNPRDTYDLLQSPKLPIAALDLRIHPPELERWSLEIVATPFFRPSPLPLRFPDGGTRAFALSDSRWLLPFPTTVASSGGFSAPLQYEVTAPSYPVSWQGGARLRVTSVGGWDFSGSYANLVESQARFAFVTAGQQNNPTLPVLATLHPSYHRQQMFGLVGGGWVSFGDTDIGTRFEGALFLRDNSRAYEAPAALQADLLRDNYVHFVLGADYTFKRKILGTVLYLNLQYVHYERIGTLEQTPGQYTLSGLPTVLPWDRNLALFWEDRIGAGGRLKLQGSLVSSLQNGDSMVNPSIAYAWSDSFKLLAGADLLFGNPRGFFGQFADNARFNFGATYLF